MGTKFQVKQGDKVLGNYHAHDAQGAVSKAIEAHKAYGPIDFSKPFDVKKGRFAATIKRGA